jgi:cytochrome c oxidase subunit 3
MWAFLATEVLFFGGLFTGYAVYRSLYPQTFMAASGTLDLVLGTINTAILLASSFTMALAVRAAQRSEPRHLQKFLLLTMGLGLGFLGIKAAEYLHKFHEHLVPGPAFAWKEMTEAGAELGPSQLFFSFYFVMTGCHAVHMLIGLGLLGVLFVQSRRGRFSADYATPVENIGLYWHFVDIIWVYLFPLLYLIDRT